MSVTGKCRFCKGGFTTKEKRTFCSLSCYWKSKKGKMTWLGKQAKKGVRLNTGKSCFKNGHIPWSKGTKGLMKAWNKGKKLHYEVWNKNRIKIVCQACSKKFTTNLYQVKDSRKFCSFECYWKTLEGNKPKNMDGLKLGRLFKGDRHGNWKGGATPLRHAIITHIEYEKWRTDVFKRDHYTCQHCKKIGGILNVHHIKPFFIIRDENHIHSVDDALNCKELWEINNGITLCEPCHRKTDTWGFHKKNYHFKIKNVNNIS